MVLCASSSLAQVDYCALEDALCGTSGTHVACTANTGFAAACVNATQIPFDSALRQTILQQHNSQRMQVATGNLPGFPSASNMLEMVSILCLINPKSNVFMRFFCQDLGR